MSVLHRSDSVFWLHVETIDVVQIAVPCLGNYWKRPPILERNRRAMLELPIDHGVSDNADAVGVGDHYRPVEKSRFFDPGSACHFAIAVFGEPSRKHGIYSGLSTRENCCHACA